MNKSLKITLLSLLIIPLGIIFWVASVALSHGDSYSSDKPRDTVSLSLPEIKGSSTTKEEPSVNTQAGTSASDEPQETTINPPTPTYETTAPEIDRSSYIAQCEKLKEAQTAKYQADTNAENVNSQTNIANIKADYQRRGLGFSGLMQEAVNKENQRHQSKRASLDADYQLAMSRKCE